ncbi:hypothetical protein PZA11_000637 [Diplocarpon coronariae]
METKDLSRCEDGYVVLGKPPWIPNVNSTIRPAFCACSLYLAAKKIGRNWSLPQKTLGELTETLLADIRADHTSFRRSIGENLVQERDEILRIIYARLIRTMFTEGTPLVSLFPIDYNESLYADFPPASQSNIGWGQRLQNFLDNLLPKFNREETNGTFFFTTFVRMVPEGQLGSAEHNCNLFVDQYQLTLLAPLHEHEFDSILDIPLELVKSITMLENKDSQDDSERIILELSKEKGKCFLDSQPIALERAQFSVAKSCLNSFRALLQEKELDFVFVENSQLAGHSQRSKKTSYSQITSESPIQDLDGSGSRPKAMTAAQTVFVRKSTPVLSESEDVPEGSPGEEKLRTGATNRPKSQVATKVSHNVANSVEADPECYGAAEEPIIAEENRYGASPKGRKTKTFDPNASYVKVVPAIPRKPKIKPQAKKPIKLPHNAGNQTPQAMSSISFGDDYYEPGKLDRVLLQKDAKFALKKFPAENKKTRVKGTSPIAKPGEKSTASTGQKRVPDEPVEEVIEPAILERQSAWQPVKADNHVMDNSFAMADAHDAPTSRDTASSKPPKPMAKPTKGHPTRLEINKSAEVGAKIKRYSINSPTASTIQAEDPTAGDMFEIPEDDQVLMSIKKKVIDVAAKTNPKEAAPTAKVPKVSKKAVYSKKRQSAPAALIPVAGTRHSQRTAAAKAKDKMRGADESQEDAEFEREIEEPQNANLKSKSQFQAILNNKTVTQDISEPRKKAEKVNNKPIASIINQGHDEDSYSPKTQKTAKTPNRFIISKYPVAPAVDIKKKTIESTLDLAAKLNNAVVVLNSDSNQNDPQQAVRLKSAMNSNIRVPSQSQTVNQGHKADTSAQASTDEPAEVLKLLEIGEEVDEASSPQKSTDESLPMEVDEFPIPLITGTTNDCMAQSQIEQPSRVISKQVPVSTGEDLDVISIDQNTRYISVACVENDLTPGLQQAAQYVVEELVSVDQPKKRKINGIEPIPAKRHQTEKGEIHAAEPAVEHISSVRKDIDRKPRVIEFDREGARNQGITTGAVRMTSQRPAVIGKSASPASVLNDRKRKRVRENLAEELSPPKRLDSSPAHTMEVNNMYLENMEIDQVGFESSPPVLERRSKTIRRGADCRQSSQPSRVNDRGSPIAAENPIDHIHKLKERLAEPLINKPIQLQEPIVESSLAPPRRRDRRFSQIFGPTISLGNKPKPRPSSPKELNSRYVPHEKTNNGTYNAVGSKHVIEPKVDLVDPFIEQARKPNGFTARLHSSASKQLIQANSELRLQGNTGGSPIARVYGIAARRHEVQQALPELPRESTSVNPRQKHGSYTDIGRRQAKDYQQSTRVDRNRRNEHDNMIQSDITTGSSSESRSSESVQTPSQERDNDRWNVALRPHYNAAGQAVHRIADEMLIRLSEEEDKMDLLVDQYKENGTKILNSLAKNRENERSLIVRKLDDKKAEMASTYSSAQIIIKETIGDLKKNPTSQTEKDWRKNQEKIRKEISEGRKIS